MIGIFALVDFRQKSRGRADQLLQIAKTLTQDEVSKTHAERRNGSSFWNE